jgi:hypothetical protein
MKYDCLQREGKSEPRQKKRRFFGRMLTKEQL